MDEKQLSFFDENLGVIQYRRKKYIQKPKSFSPKKTYIDYVAEGIMRGSITYEDASLSLLRPNRFGDLIENEKTTKLKYAINRLKNKK